MSTHPLFGRLVFILTMLAAMSLAGACASRVASPYATPSEAARDPQWAHELTRRAADLMVTEPKKAKSLLREALAADIFHGPAHNNLGVIHLQSGDLYEAASEFEWARKLMPGHPDPRLNLGVALERAGRIDEALQAYRTALDVFPGHLPSIQALTRAEVRYDRIGSSTADRLEEIAFRSDEPWREWARREAIRVGHPLER